MNSQYTFRPATLADAPQIHALQRAVSAQDQPDRIVTLQEVEADFSDPYGKAEHDSLVALDVTGTLVGLMWVFVPPEPVGEIPASLTALVHPAHRQRGIGHYLQTWGEKRAAERLSNHAESGLRRLYRVGARDSQLDRLKLFKEYGYGESRAIYRMRRDLHQPISPLVLPANIKFLTYQPEHDALAWRAIDESFEDHWGHQPLTFDEWHLYYTHSPDFRADLTVIALDTERNEVAAACMMKVVADEVASTGMKIAWLLAIGVRRPWRKMGLGAALVSQAMLNCRAAGLDYLRLGVDSDNPTGALRLYERLGFRPIWRWVWQEKNFV